MFHAAEGDRRAGDLGTVHRHHTELQCPAGPVDAARIPRVQIGDEAVLRFVGTGKRFLLGVEGGDGRDRPEGLLVHDQRIGGNIGEHGRLEKKRARPMTLAAGQQSGALFERVGDMLFLLGDRLFVHQGTDIRIVETGTDGKRGRALGEAAAKFVIHRSLDKDPVGPQAVLPRGGKLRLDPFGQGEIHVRVGKEQEWRVAAKFHDHPLHGLGALPVQQLSNLRRRGDRQGAHARVLRPRWNNDRGTAGHHIEHARRKTGPFGQFGERQAGKRRFAGGMNHDGATGGQRRRGLAGDHGRGEVPRRDQRRHADRFQPNLHFPVRQVGRDVLDIRAFGLLGVELHEGRRIGDLAPRLRDRLALFQGHDDGEIFLVLDHEIVPASYDRRALLRQQARPTRKRAVGRIHGFHAFPGRQVGHAAQAFAGSGIGHVNGPSVAARHPCPADIARFTEKSLVRQVAGYCIWFSLFCSRVHRLSPDASRHGNNKRWRGVILFVLGARNGRNTKLATLKRMVYRGWLRPCRVAQSVPIRSSRDGGVDFTGLVTMYPK